MNPSTLPFVLSAARLPLIVKPGGISGAEELAHWLSAHPEWIAQGLRECGALLFRGFKIDNVDDVEVVARAVEPSLQNEYMGTSPRLALSKSGYVFSASELPDFYPLPAHCEMSFTSNPPKRIFFACTIEPQVYGETPLIDFRGVYRDLDPDLRARWSQKGIRIVRNYSGPLEKKGLLELKKWTEIFNTTDRAEVEKACAREGFEAVWKKNGRLALISTQQPVRPHPQSGEPVWFNHAQVFHLDAPHLEYWRVFKLRPTWRHFRYWLMARALSTWKRLTVGPEDQAMHVTFGDGSAIPRADMRKVFDAIWKNMSITPWRKGDIVAIDNNIIGHGRLPFEGPREIVVSWA